MMSKHKFDFETINDFDHHISSSILGYNMLHSLVVNITGFFINERSVVYDLGCTTGRLLIEINKAYGVDCIGYDITGSNFLKPSSDKVKLNEQDITSNNLVLPKMDLCYLVFTLQFLQIDDRAILLKKIHKSLRPNGVLIVCEKEICKDGVIQEVFTFSNYENKRKEFSEAEILDKEKALRQVMNSLNSDENIKMFKKVGFKIIEPFFQSLNFKGYILRK